MVKMLGWQSLLQTAFVLKIESDVKYYYVI